MDCLGHRSNLKPFTGKWIYHQRWLVFSSFPIRKMVIPGSLKLITKNHSKQEKVHMIPNPEFFGHFFGCQTPNKFTTTPVWWNGRRCICARVNQLPIWEMVGPPPWMTGILIMATKKTLLLGECIGKQWEFQPWFLQNVVSSSPHINTPDVLSKSPKCWSRKNEETPALGGSLDLWKWLYSSGGYNPIYN